MQSHYPLLYHSDAVLNFKKYLLHECMTAFDDRCEGNIAQRRRAFVRADHMALRYCAWK